jgi:thiopeptide-type bacteriocin biosynthesis protein
MGSIPFKPDGRMSTYRFLDGLLLRAPFYSFSRYAPERLPQVLLSKEFQQAVQLASPVFYGLVKKKEFDFNKLSDKERFTLLKYYNRMCFRPTPFGAFASFTALDWADGRAELAHHRESCLYLLPEDPPEQDEPLRETDRLSLSPLLYRLKTEFRFIRRHLPEGEDKYRFTLDALAAEPLTVKLLARLEKGSEMAAGLARWMTGETGCAAGQALDYLNFLRAQQVLYVTGARRPLISDQNPEVQGRNRPSFDPDTRYYAVMERPGEGGASAADRKELEKGVAALQMLYPAEVQTGGALARFITAFSARFADQKIPLLEALDPDAGVSYEGSPLPPAPAWTTTHRLFLRLWLQNAARGPYDPILISNEDLAAEERNEPRYPATTSLLFRRAGDALLIEHAGGATATALAGRFSLFSDRVLHICRGIAASEKAANPGVVFADVSCTSGPHVDNINSRRRIYDHEISLGNVSDDADPERLLLPAALVLSVQGGELVLESTRLQKRVMPRLSTAFNHRHNGLGLFRLLCDMQYQGVRASLGLDLEMFFPGLPFYPRVSYGRCVLAQAKWKLDGAQLHGGLLALRNVCERFRLPRQVSCGIGDQQLVFDLSDETEALFFLRYIEGKEELTLTEYLPSGRSVASGHRELAGQYLAFLAHDQSLYRPSPAPFKVPVVKMRRTFVPGSEWLYIKLYCTPTASLKVLLEIVAPVLRANREHYAAWFFVRYADPEPHIRLRVCQNGTSSGILLSALARRASTGGRAELVRAFRVDTYERELERYGPDLMSDAEAVFCAGSELALAALRAELPETSFAVLTAFHMCRIFLSSAEQCLQFAARSAEVFAAEFSLDKTQRIQMDAAYRKQRTSLTGIFAQQPQKRKMRRLVKAMKGLSTAAAGVSSERRLRLLSDICHMQLNRCFTTDQRRQEMEVWYYLQKFLTAQAARAGARKRQV